MKRILSVMAVFIVLALLVPLYAQTEKPEPAKDTTKTTATTTTTTTQTTPTEQKTNTGLTVENMICGTAVQDRDIQGETTTFSTNIEKVYCWCQITGSNEPTRIEHVWYYDGKEVARVPLDVNYPNMRTWSSKTITPEKSGDWKVELIDQTGKILYTTAFVIE